MADSFLKIMDDSAKAAIFTKFKSYFGLTTQSTDIVFAPKGVCQRRIAEKRGSDTVEFISLWRSGIGFDWNRGNMSLARNGVSLEYSLPDYTAILTAKAVPVKITYDVWFWSRTLDKINNALETYLFWRHDNPNLVLNYLDTYPLELDLLFGDIVDESPIDQEYDKGLYFVYRMPITLEGWVFSTFSSKTILDIYVKLYLREGTPPDQVDTLLDTFHITSTSIS